MKLRMGINVNNCGTNTPNSKCQSNEYYKNQKRRHAEVKSCSTIEMDQKTPVHKPFFNHRKRSLNGTSVSNFNSFITPLSSTNKENFSLVMRSSGSSSGYHSIKKTNSIVKKKTDTFKVPIRKSLNMGAYLENTNKNFKIGKCRLYQNKKIKNCLPPRALANNSGTSSSFELWRCMAEKQEIYKRDPNYFSRHSQINPEMRCVLLEWMIDVCVAYSLDMETFYLATDYFDRYLSVVNDIPIHSLQAVGTTTLYIAAKLHEITPPHIENFVNVTDGACTCDEILAHESHILLKLNWHLQPITPLSWLTLFLQISHIQEGENKGQAEYSEYKGPLTRMRYMRSFENTYLSKNFLERININDNFDYYVKALNACICDVGSMRYSYDIISATLLHLITDIDVFNITGFGTDEISACMKWLKQFTHSTTSNGLLNSMTPSPPLNDCTNYSKIEHSSRSSKISRIQKIIGNDKENIAV